MYKILYISTIYIVMYMTSAYTYAQREPTSEHQSLVAVVQDSFMARIDQRTPEKSAQVHAKLDDMYRKYVRSPLAVWFIQEIRETITQLDGMTGASDVPIYKPLVATQQAAVVSPTITKQLLVTENEL